MPLSLIDLHCDTLYEIAAHKKDFSDPTLAICLTDSMKDMYEHYVQIAAYWSDSSLSDEECFTRFQGAMALFRDPIMQRAEFEILRDFSRNSLLSAPSHQLILAVEDARLLAGSLERLQIGRAHV